jgi:hypothetical protein
MMGRQPQMRLRRFKYSFCSFGFLLRLASSLRPSGLLWVAPTEAFGYRNAAHDSKRSPNIVALPPLTKKGVLPPGIHECTFDEVKAAFAGLPPQPGRLNLWKSFISYVEAIRPLGLVISVYINGGFTTNGNRANDIDVVLELPPPTPAARTMANRREFNGPYVHQTYKVHIFPLSLGMPANADMRQYFQQPNPKYAALHGLKPTDRKGLAKVTL